MPAASASWSTSRASKSHDIILKGIQILINLTHRGACGCDPETGDGAGVLIQIPHEFFARECAQARASRCRAPGEYGVGMVFLPVERARSGCSCEGILERIVREEGLTVLGWRDTPIDGDAIGRVARASQPYIQQIFIGRAHGHGPGRRSSASSTWSASARKRRSPASDMPRQGLLLHPVAVLAAPSSTRDCCWRRRSRDFYRELSRSRTWSARCAWCTSASPPTRSRPGNWRTRSATSATTARSTRCAATSTGCTRGRSVLASPLFGDDIKKLFPDHHARRQRLGDASTTRVELLVHGRAAACRTSWRC